MEGGDDDFVGLFFADEFGDTFAHFSGGFIGEGHGENFFGLGFPGSENVSDAAGDDTGFSTTGSGNDEEGPFDMAHGGGLIFVESC